MLNKLIITFSNYLGWILESLKLDKTIRSKDDIRLVFYHGIGDKKSASMTYLNDEIPRYAFEAHINYLQDRYTLVSLSEAVDLLSTDKLPKNKPVCTISFDDGLHSVYSDAYPILKKRGIAFDVFLNTSVIGNDSLLWLHALNYLSTTYGPANVATIINRLKDENLTRVASDAVGIERWCRANFDYFHEHDIIGKLFEYYGLNQNRIAQKENLYLSWNQIEEMSFEGVDFYSHTHSHFPLNSFLNEAIIKDEITISRDIMKDHRKSDQFISFPFGMIVDYGKKSITHAFSAGHKYIVEVGDGLNSANRVMNGRMMSRVGLGNTESSSSKIYSAIELRPVIKSKLKSVVRK